MIAVDTSALMALLRREGRAQDILEALTNAAALTISAGTLTDALIVAQGRGVGDEMAQLIEDLGVEVAPVSHATARSAAAAHAAWGKGVHPAALNFGDCFAYALAREHELPLLYVGDDFARTDLDSVLA